MNEIRNDHNARILRVLNHIQQHLDDALCPADLAAVACFSLHHFHRIFKGMTGESVMGHIRRLRLERAAARLKFEETPVTRIAFEACYENHESFTRAFGQLFGCSPAEFRQNHRPIAYPSAPSGVHYSPEGAVAKFHRFHNRGGQPMEIKQLPARRVICLRHTGPYIEVGKAWQQLCTWAGQHGLIGPASEMLGLSYDDPEITPADKLRYDACITIDREIEPEGEIQVRELSAGDYAVIRHRGPYEKLNETYAELFGAHLPGSQREAADAPCIEAYRNSPEETRPEDLETDIMVLLKP